MELNLIVRSNHPVEAPTRPLFTVNGQRWSLAGPFTLDRLDKSPDFTCVSYVWGTGRTLNPAFSKKRVLMSDNTLPALAAAARLSSAPAFWIDGFCIPLGQPARGATLESMGYIYSAAKEVVVALSAECSDVVEEMGTSDKLGPDHLRALEKDEWIRSIWTYQEVVNSQSLCFTTADAQSRAATAGDVFLNRVGFSMEALRKERGSSSLDVRREFPRMDAFADLIADWMMAGYAERSALLVMANLDLRHCAAPANYFYSMIGSITDQPSPRSAGEAVEDLAEKCMTICEDKGDYSFIFVAVQRDSRARRRWRPRAGTLTSILQWHSWGLQGGYRDSRGLWLENMVELEEAAILGQDARNWILESKWFAEILPRVVDVEQQFMDTHIAAIILKFLREIGFTGCGGYLFTSLGVVFLWASLDTEGTLTLAAANDLRWTFGAPLIAVCEDGDGKRYTPGVFVGRCMGLGTAHFLLDV